MRKFATTAKRPSAITAKKPPKAAAKPRRPPVKAKLPKAAPKPVRLKPGKPQRPKKPKTPPKKRVAPKKPVKTKPVKTPPKKPSKPKKPKAPPKPPKQWISQMFGKNRREKIRAITSEDRQRIKDAEESIEETRRQTRKHHLPFGPTEISPLGYEYYELIAAIEKMSAHDVYTLFMSP